MVMVSVSRRRARRRRGRCVPRQIARQGRYCVGPARATARPIRSKLHNEPTGAIWRDHNLGNIGIRRWFIAGTGHRK